MFLSRRLRRKLSQFVTGGGGVESATGADDEDYPTHEDVNPTLETQLATPYWPLPLPLTYPRCHTVHPYARRSPSCNTRKDKRKIKTQTQNTWANTQRFFFGKLNGMIRAICTKFVGLRVITSQPYSPQPSPSGSGRTTTVSPRISGVVFAVIDPQKPPLRVKQQEDDSQVQLPGCWPGQSSWPTQGT